jgi:hypothetical protein
VPQGTAQRRSLPWGLSHSVGSPRRVASRHAAAAAARRKHPSSVHGATVAVAATHASSLAGHTSPLECSNLPTWLEERRARVRTRRTQCIPRACRPLYMPVSAGALVAAGRAPSAYQQPRATARPPPPHAPAARAPGRRSQGLPARRPRSAPRRQGAPRGRPRPPAQRSRPPRPPQEARLTAPGLRWQPQAQRRRRPARAAPRRQPGRSQESARSRRRRARRAAPARRQSGPRRRPPPGTSRHPRGQLPQRVHRGAQPHQGPGPQPAREKGILECEECRPWPMRRTDPGGGQLAARRSRRACLKGGSARRPARQGPLPARVSSCST